LDLAKFEVPRKLLHGGLCPSSERLKIRERLDIVVISVPKRRFSSNILAASGPKQAFPHAGRRIHSGLLVAVDDLVDKLIQKLAVTFSAISFPRTRRNDIRFDIDPDCIKIL